MIAMCVDETDHAIGFTQIKTGGREPCQRLHHVGIAGQCQVLFCLLKRLAHEEDRRHTGQSGALEHFAPIRIERGIREMRVRIN